jgi:hypothetical protein
VYIVTRQALTHACGYCCVVLLHRLLVTSPCGASCCGCRITMAILTLPLLHFEGLQLLAGRILQVSVNVSSTMRKHAAGTVVCIVQLASGAGKRALHGICLHDSD